MRGPGFTPHSQAAPVIEIYSILMNEPDPEYDEYADVFMWNYNFVLHKVYQDMKFKSLLFPHFPLPTPLTSSQPTDWPLFTETGDRDTRLL